MGRARSGSEAWPGSLGVLKGAELFSPKHTPYGPGETFDLEAWTRPTGPAGHPSGGAGEGVAAKPRPWLRPLCGVERGGPCTTAGIDSGCVEPFVEDAQGDSGAAFLHELVLQHERRCGPVEQASQLGTNLGVQLRDPSRLRHGVGATPWTTAVHTPASHATLTRNVSSGM